MNDKKYGDYLRHFNDKLPDVVKIHKGHEFRDGLRDIGGIAGIVGGVIIDIRLAPHLAKGVLGYGGAGDALACAPMGAFGGAMMAPVRFDEERKEKKKDKGKASIDDLNASIAEQLKDSAVGAPVGLLLGAGTGASLPWLAAPAALGAAGYLVGDFIGNTIDHSLAALPRNKPAAKVKK